MLQNIFFLNFPVQKEIIINRYYVFVTKNVDSEFRIRYLVVWSHELVIIQENRSNFGPCLITNTPESGLRWTRILILKFKVVKKSNELRFTDRSPSTLNLVLHFIGFRTKHLMFWLGKISTSMKSQLCLHWIKVCPYLKHSNPRFFRCLFYFWLNT